MQGSAVNIGKKNFMSVICPTVFCALLRSAALISKGSLTDADVSIQNLKRGKTFKTIDIRQVNESIFSL